MPKEIANQEIELLLDTLSQKEKQCVLWKIFDDKKTKEIAESFKVSRSRVDQIYKKALRKLRHPSRVSYMRFIGFWDSGGRIYELDEFDEKIFRKKYLDKPKLKPKPKPKPKPKKKPNPTEDDYSGVVHRGFKREVLPGVWMHDPGHDPRVKCPACDGVGQSESIMGYVSIKQTCLKCEGTGTIHQIKWVN